MDWNTKGESVGQASCYSWVVGTLGFVKEYYEKNPKEVVDNFFTASQEYLSSKVIEKFGELNFWPGDWFCSFRFHCMPKFGPSRHFVAPKIPQNENLKFIVFHGTPNPREAIKGIWELKSTDKSWKRLYKVCKPTTWIKDLLVLKLIFKIIIKECSIFWNYKLYNTLEIFRKLLKNQLRSMDRLSNI